jgi:hypothetical protein
MSDGCDARIAPDGFHAAVHLVAAAGLRRTMRRVRARVCTSGFRESCLCDALRDFGQVVRQCSLLHRRVAVETDGLSDRHCGTFVQLPVRLSHSFRPGDRYSWHEAWAGTQSEVGQRKLQTCASLRTESLGGKA